MQLQLSTAALVTHTLNQPPCAPSNSASQIATLVPIASKADVAAAERLLTAGACVIMDADAAGWKVIPGE